MLNFTYENGVLKTVSYEFSRDAINRNDFKTLADAERVATEATELTGKLHVAADKGDSTWPRYDVIEAPRVGDEVSRGFNGDYYPAGTITAISATLKRVVTSDGTIFYRRRNSATWVAEGTWAMVAGHKDERNPSF